MRKTLSTILKSLTELYDNLKLLMKLSKRKLIDIQIIYSADTKLQKLIDVIIAEAEKMIRIGKSLFSAFSAILQNIFIISLSPGFDKMALVSGYENNVLILLKAERVKTILNPSWNALRLKQSYYREKDWSYIYENI